MKTKSKPRAYFVEYNAKFMAIYKTLNGALKFIQRKGYRTDYYNLVRIWDDKGNEYNTINGNLL